MTLKEKNKNAFEELDRLIASVDKEVLKQLIDKHEKTAIQGPTFREYFNSLDNELCFEFGGIASFDEQYYSQNLVEPYYISYNETNTFYDPPPVHSKKKRKKDSAISQSLFFCL